LYQITKVLSISLLLHQFMFFFISYSVANISTITFQAHEGR